MNLDTKNRGGELFLLASSNDDGPPVPIGITDPQTGEITVAGKSRNISLDKDDEHQLNYYIQLFSQSAERLELLPSTSHSLRFEAGQIFYKDGQVEELRLRCNMESPDHRKTLWETDNPPLMHISGTDSDEEISLDTGDKGRAHFSIQVTTNENGHKVLLFLWDLRANLPEEASILHRSGAESISISSTNKINFEPVPLPHRAISEAAPLTTIRGLGRSLVPAKYQDTPDLDRKTSDIAQKAAQKLLWESVENILSNAVDNNSTEACWTRNTENDQVIYTVSNLQEQETRELWNEVKASLNVGNGGPGLQASDPAIVANNHFDAIKGHSVIETRLIFWPEKVLQYQDGYSKPGVYFRSNQSPGYVALLNSHGDNPFKADGWLWLPKDSVREGYRLAGRAEYVFQEGVQAMSSLENLLISHHEEEIDRIQGSIRSTLPFHETVMAKEDLVKQLKDDIRRAKDHIATLSTFDCLNPLKCVLYAFHNQREAWANEQLKLPGGELINTSPYRVIQLDPTELKYFLNATGDTWRTLIWRRLQALASFERTTWTKSGRRVESGDRFIHVLLDGYRTKEEMGAKEHERGLWKVLRQEGAVPSDAFFAVLSPDFLDRCYSWERDADGKIVFGAEAAALKAKKTTKFIEAKTIRDEENRKSATYADSKRLTALSERENWSSERKLLVTRISEARTVNTRPGRKNGNPVPVRSRNSLGGNYLLRKIDDTQYEVCRGTRGKGYSVTGWMKVGGYTTKGDQRQTSKAYRNFIADLEYLSENLGFELQIPKKFKKTKRVIEFLSNNRKKKTELLQIDILIPLDIEDLLQKHLDTFDTKATESNPVPGKPEKTVKIEKPQSNKQKREEPNLQILDKLKDQLKAAGILQSDLAEMLDVSRESINRWFSPSSAKKIPDKRIRQILEILDSK